MIPGSRYLTYMSIDAAKCVIHISQFHSSHRHRPTPPAPVTPAHDTRSPPPGPPAPSLAGPVSTSVFSSAGLDNHDASCTTFVRLRTFHHSARSFSINFSRLDTGVRFDSSSSVTTSSASKSDANFTLRWKIVRHEAELGVIYAHDLGLLYRVSTQNKSSAPSGNPVGARDTTSGCKLLDAQVKGSSFPIESPLHVYA
jgi:hypothetical protein